MRVLYKREGVDWLLRSRDPRISADYLQKTGFLTDWGVDVRSFEWLNYNSSDDIGTILDVLNAEDIVMPRPMFIHNLARNIHIINTNNNNNKKASEDNYTFFKSLLAWMEPSIIGLLLGAAASLDKFHVHYGECVTEVLKNRPCWLEHDEAAIVEHQEPTHYFAILELMSAIVGDGKLMGVKEKAAPATYSKEKLASLKASDDDGDGEYEDGNDDGEAHHLIIVCRRKDCPSHDRSDADADDAVLKPLKECAELCAFLCRLYNVFVDFDGFGAGVAMRKFRQFAEEHEFTLDPLAPVFDRYANKLPTTLEKALVHENARILACILIDAVEKKVPIDFSAPATNGETLLQTVFGDKDKVAAVMKVVERYVDLFTVSDTDRYDALSVLGRYDDVIAHYATQEGVTGKLAMAAAYRDRAGDSDHAKALAIYDGVIGPAPTSKDAGKAMYGKALVYERQARPTAEIEKLLNEAIEVDVNQPLYDMTLAKILLKGTTEAGVAGAYSMAKVRRLAEGVVNEKDSAVQRIFKTPAQRELFRRVAGTTVSFSSVASVTAATTTAAALAKASRARMQEDIITKVMQSFNSGIQISQRSAAALQDELDEVRRQLNGVKNTLKDARVEDAARVNRSIAEFRKQPKVYMYFSTFYWTLANYLDSYRVLSSGMVAKTGSMGGNDAVNAKKKAAGRAEMAGFLAKKVPVIGGVFATVTSVVKGVIEFKAGVDFDKALREMMTQIAACCGTAAALSELLATVAIEMTYARGKEIVALDDVTVATRKALDSAAAVPAKLSKYVRAKRWFAAKVEGAKASVGCAECDSPLEKLALADVCMFLQFLLQYDVDAQTHTLTASSAPSSADTLTTTFLAVVDPKYMRMSLVRSFVAYENGDVGDDDGDDGGAAAAASGGGVGGRGTAALRKTCARLSAYVAKLEAACAANGVALPTADGARPASPYKTMASAASEKSKAKSSSTLPPLK
jgi:hypothetical protein